MAELKSLRDELHLHEQLSTDCHYADDTTMIAAIFQKLKLSTQELEKACSKWGMKINVKKCKIISPETDNITIEGNDIEKVESFTYLGSVVPGTESDVKRRIALASTAFGNLKENIFSRKDVPKKLKVRLYKALIVPIAIYAGETWSLREEDKRKLIVFENNCLRIIAGVALSQRVRLETIRADLDITDTIIELIQWKRLNWFGNILRHDPQKSYVYLSYKSEFQNCRPRGRTPLRWKNQIKKNIGLPLLTAERYAKDKTAGEIVWNCVDRSLAKAS